MTAAKYCEEPVGHLTVGELRDALRKVPPSASVFLDDADGPPELVSVDFVDGQVWLEFEDSLSPPGPDETGNEPRSKP